MITISPGMINAVIKCIISCSVIAVKILKFVAVWCVGISNCWVLYGVQLFIVNSVQSGYGVYCEEYGHAQYSSFQNELLKVTLNIGARVDRHTGYTLRSSITTWLLPRNSQIIHVSTTNFQKFVSILIVSCVNTSPKIDTSHYFLL